MAIQRQDKPARRRNIGKGPLGKSNPQRTPNQLEFWSTCSDFQTSAPSVRCKKIWAVLIVTLRSPRGSAGEKLNKGFLEPIPMAGLGR